MINELPIWSQEIKTVAKKLDTNFSAGLKMQIAKQRLITNGPNQLPMAQQVPWWKILFHNLVEPFMFVLFALAIIVAVLGEWAELAVLLAIIIVEATIASVQEIKAAASLKSLKTLIQQTAIVIRDGSKMTVDVKDLVVGDLVVLEAGMFIPADLRIVKAFNLKVNESLLTGESNLVAKDSAVIPEPELTVGDCKNLAYMSTIVTTGTGLGIVYATANQTEIGKIRQLLVTEKGQPSTLKKQIMLLIRVVSIVALVLSAIMFLVQYFIYNIEWKHSLVLAIAIAVAVIPEGTAIVVSASLALGSTRMAKKNAIVKKITAVETLGQVDIICSDKTGTLTQNQMKVQQCFLYEKSFSAEQFSNNSLQTQLFLNAIVLANNGLVTDAEIVGEPTETALLTWAMQLNIPIATLVKQLPRVYEFAFDSNRKLMSTINQDQTEKMAFVKGAPEQLLDKCQTWLIGEQIVNLTVDLRKKILEAIQQLSNQALRVLGAAYRPLSQDDTTMSTDAIENNLCFLGLVGMIDPPRPEVKAALVKTRIAGINTKMITGDHQNTAVAIGQELNLLTDSSQAITGVNLERLSDEELAQQIDHYQVFARVSPEHKVRIVKALQKKQHIVAMTGDGVNDAPSLKASNIGIAMGITGTDVAKDAAQLILTDDNFSTIVDAIEEGRNIYSKLKRIICFILITNLSQVMTIMLGTALGIGELLTSLQILWINLIVESILGISLSLTKNNHQLMKQKPVPKTDNLFSGNWWFITINSLLLAGLLIICYLYIHQVFGISQTLSNSYAFIIMVNAPIFYSLSFTVTRSVSLFNLTSLKNKYFFIVMLIAILLNAIIIFTPVINTAFGIKPEIRFSAYIYCLLISLIPVVFLEIFKWLHNWRIQKKSKALSHY